MGFFFFSEIFPFVSALLALTFWGYFNHYCSLHYFDIGDCWAPFPGWNFPDLSYAKQCWIISSSFWISLSWDSVPNLIPMDKASIFVLGGNQLGWGQLISCKQTSVGFGFTVSSLFKDFGVVSICSLFGPLGGQSTGLSLQTINSILKVFGMCIGWDPHSQAHTIFTYFPELIPFCVQSGTDDSP